MTDSAENSKIQSIDGRLLARNTMVNLVGHGVPLLVTIFAVPVLIHGLGADRFGVLTLVWMIVGYFSLFDLGLGRVLTQWVAERLGTGKEQEIPQLIWTSLLLMLIFGALGAMTAVLFSPWLVYKVLKIPDQLQPESLSAFYLVAGSIPIVISNAGLRGILEAKQQFGSINAIRIFTGTFTFLGPLFVLPFSKNLFLMAAVLVLARFITWVLHLLLCFHAIPGLHKKILFERAVIAPLLRFGGWMTVTNVIGPLMVYLDRFLIGAMMSSAAVAYYTIPYEVVTKLWLVPSALTGVLFPAFAGSFAQDRNRTILFFGRGAKYVFLSLFPFVLLIVSLADEGLGFWLGYEFASQSTHVLQWLVVGVLFSSLGSIPFALIQGVGRPDLTAKLHLLELPFYLSAVWGLIHTLGIVGAAIAWAVRMMIDALLLFWIARRSLLVTLEIRSIIFTMGVAFLVLTFAVLPLSLATKGIFLSLVLFAFFISTWLVALGSEERVFIRNCFKKAYRFRWI